MSKICWKFHILNLLSFKKLYGLRFESCKLLLEITLLKQINSLTDNCKKLDDIFSCAQFPYSFKKTKLPLPFNNGNNLVDKPVILIYTNIILQSSYKLLTSTPLFLMWSISLNKIDGLMTTPLAIMHVVCG